MINCSSEVPRLEEVDRVQVGDVDPPGVWLVTLAAVLLQRYSALKHTLMLGPGLYLYVHSKETDINTVLLFKGEHGPGSVGEVVHHLTGVDVSN